MNFAYTTLFKKTLANLYILIFTPIDNNKNWVSAKNKINILSFDIGLFFSKAWLIILPSNKLSNFLKLKYN